MFIYPAVGALGGFMGPCSRGGYLGQLIGLLINTSLQPAHIRIQAALNPVHAFLDIPQVGGKPSGLLSGTMAGRLPSNEKCPDRKGHTDDCSHGWDIHSLSPLLECTKLHINFA